MDIKNEFCRQNFHRKTTLSISFNGDSILCARHMKYMFHNGDSILCARHMKYMFHWHMSPTDVGPICGAHMSVRHMSHTPRAYESLFTQWHLNWVCYNTKRFYVGLMCQWDTCLNLIRPEHMKILPLNDTSIGPATIQKDFTTIINSLFIFTIIWCD